MVSEYRAVWSTPGGGTGYSVFHATDADDSTEAQIFADSVRGFFDVLKGLFPDEVSISFESEVKNLTNAGTLTAVFAVNAPGTVTGINVGTYNRAAGARIDWLTDTIVNGRRLKGRTYLVPCAAATFDSSGLVTSANIAAIQAAGQGLRDAMDPDIQLVVWSRANETFDLVSGQSTPPKGAILRGRRD